MKKLLLPLVAFWSASLFSQNIDIQEVILTSQNGEMNVNMKTVAYNGAGFLSSTYTVTDNVINLDVCFWFNATLPVLTFDNNFPIALQNEGNYTLHITVHNSSSNEICDYYSVGDTYTTAFLSTGEIMPNEPFLAFPNPVTDKLNFSQPITNLHIFDVTGRLIRLETNATSQINLVGLPNGIYLISALREKEKVTTKIVVHN